MKLHITSRLNSIIMGFALLVFSSAGFTAGGNYSSNTDLKPILKLIDQGDYHSAIDMLYDEL